VHDFARNIPSIVTSIAVHVVVLAVLILIPIGLQSASPDITLESIFTQDVPQEQITRELELDTTPTETLNFIAGGTPSTAVGAAAQPVAVPVNVQEAKVMKEVDIRPVLTDMALPSDDLIGMELGEGEVTGEIGAMVEGYGAAMGILTQEIIRMMRQQKVTVVWLFDESSSLEDDRREIRENYLRVYDELGIAAQQDADLRRGSDVLLTVVASYGADIHEQTPRPTADVEMIRQAIDRIPVDQSGTENMCHSIARIVNKYRNMALKGKRKLAIIVVSDESGDDGEYVEEAISAARGAKAPLYFLGRESMFGYPYARQRWTHEESGEQFWLRVRRGPETAFPECLQWNGLHARWDVQRAGFGPYEQTRMAKETGGIFFVLPGDEESLVGQGGVDKKKYEFLAMREYQPVLLARPAYVQERATQQFRDTVWQVISRLNPSSNSILFQNSDPELNIKSEHYPLPLAEFRQAAAPEAIKAAKAMLLTEEGISLLERVRSERALEAMPRWRAAYDLATAQLYLFRLRLYQFLLTMDEHANNMPKPKNSMSTRWNIRWNRRTITPNEIQFKRLQTAFGIKMSRDDYIATVKAQEKATTAMMKKVIKDHPDTPWAQRAQLELNSGFGFNVYDVVWDPRNIRQQIVAKGLPKL
jgi:von Willebrand factor type A domain